MTEEKLHLKMPSLAKRLLERKDLIEIRPADLCNTQTQLDALLNKYPDLAGDRTAIGISDDDGDCQSWRHDPGWWKELLARES